MFLRKLLFVCVVGYLTGIGAGELGTQAYRRHFVRQPGVTTVEHYR